MDADELERFEAEIRARCEAGDLAGATTAALRGYGPEIYGFLRALARHDDLAAEAFAQLGEDLWKGLPAFRWDTRLRSWSYTLARNALHRLRRDPRRTPARNLGLSAVQAADLADQLRTATALYRRTEVKDALRALRDELPPEDHELLLLRLDRHMSWKDIARIHDDTAGPGLTARAAALRKQFERAKGRLRALAVERGIMKSET